MISIGVDIGSLFAKAVLMSNDDLAAARIVRTTGDIADRMDGLLKALAADAGLDSGSRPVMATGNSADLIREADSIEDTVNCIAAAAYFFLDKIDMVIDIGGQSITSMLLDSDGRVINMMRNDKCAAGSGRFLEAMAARLNVDVAGIDETTAASTRPALISNQCGVFAESEVITHVNAGESVADIVAGVCSSVANIVVAQGRRFAPIGKYTITGGVGRIKSVVRVVSGKLGGSFVEFPRDPALAAAIGAALLGESE